MFSAYAKEEYSLTTAKVDVKLTDEPCVHPEILTLILPDYAPLFKAYTSTARTEEQAAFWGQKVINGCWSDHPDVAPKGQTAWVHELGGMGYQDLSAFEKAKTGI